MLKKFCALLYLTLYAKKNGSHMSQQRKKMGQTIYDKLNYYHSLLKKVTSQLKWTEYFKSPLNVILEFPLSMKYLKKKQNLVD